MISVAAEDVGFTASFLRIDGHTAVPVPMGPEVQARPETRRAGRFRGLSVAIVGGRWTGMNAGSRGPFSDDVGNAAALVFNGSFASLFGRLFDSQPDSASATGDVLAEDRNPFAELKQREQASRQAAEPAEGASPQPPKSESQPRSVTQQEAAFLPGGGVEQNKFVIIGDLDGSGVLSAVIVDRSGDVEFTFPDGTRKGFSLFVNPAAIEYQRSLALEDINGDGVPDLLVTSRASLLGGVLLGDGEGEFRTAGSFVTGYEPILATVGPQRELGREIVTVNLRTGIVNAFHPGGGYRNFQASQLDFAPDYIAHIVELVSGTDYLAAAQGGMQPRLYRWMPDSSLQSEYGSLPAEASLEAGASPHSRAAIGWIRVHQIGEYASVLLGNRAGQEFNVANLKVSPQFFLVFGDLERRGNLDVGVGTIVYLTPSK